MALAICHENIKKGQFTSILLYSVPAPQRGAEVKHNQQQQQPSVGPRPVLTKKDNATVTSPVEIKPIPIGDPKVRSKLTFEVVTARVAESGGKKHVVRASSMFKVDSPFNAIFCLGLYGDHEKSRP